MCKNKNFNISHLIFSTKDKDLEREGERKRERERKKNYSDKRGTVHLRKLQTGVHPPLEIY